jgi:hypothetical protein
MAGVSPRPVELIRDDAVDDLPRQLRIAGA